MKTSKFPKVNQKQSFPVLEEEMLKFWQENNVFEESISSRENCDEFAFYDGPPFATGTPHYGHILAGTIKDVIPRYQTMLGKKVDRKFGWDCHGLPIENIVEKKMNISGKDDIENKIGVHEFNETCRANVFGYVDEWKKTVNRMGRWVDMENDYKTMDKSFMESVWSVFKNIYDKGLIYEGNRVVPYCPRCTTPLSNFEVNQGYKDKQSKAVTVKFKVKGSENKYILAWTTTPWTLLANLGLAVGEDLMYSELLDNKTREIYILASSRINTYYKNEEDYKILREYKGSCLIGIEYEPIFNDFFLQLKEMKSDLGTGIELGENSFKVVAGHHVTTDSGVGIVHIAPAFGEDDNIIGKEQKLGFVSHINDHGKTYNLLENNDINVFEFNEKVIEILKQRGVTLRIETITHSYPHCWRCSTPLIYRAISAWYVAVEQIKDRMLKNNDKINWTPEIIKHGRFGKWLEGAKDWNISRNRYWGSAIPVWQSEDKKEEVCVGSIEELYNLNKDFGDITKVIFVRHGRTDYNDLNLMDYKDKARLNESGKNQSIEIKELYKNTQIDVIFSSPLTRCLDTISPLANEKGLEINIINGLVEGNWGDLQDGVHNCSDFKWNDEKLGGGESIIDIYNRVEKTLNELIENNKGKTILICSHGDPILLMRKALHGFDYDLKKKEYSLNNKPKNGLPGQSVIEYVYTKNKKSIDLHKHFVDEIFVKNPQTGNTLKRIPEVLDCWFESGAMPYASKGLILESEKKEEKQTTKIILVRHGKSEKLDQNSNETFLNEIGINQAELLKEELESENIDIIYSSPLSRCIYTISPTARSHNKDIIIEENLREVDKGNLILVDWNYYRKNKDDKIGGTGETYNQIYDRVVRFYKNLLKNNKGKNIVITSHGGILFTLLDIIGSIESVGENGFLLNEEIGISSRLLKRYVCSETGKAENNKQIKNLVFDFGGVLLNAGTLEANLRLFDPNFDFETFKNKYSNEIELAHIKDTDVLYDGIIKFLGGNISKEQILNTWAENINFTLTDKLLKLSEKYDLYIFSNTTPNLLETFLKNHSLEKYFKNIIKSCEYGYQKPAKEFYKVLFEKCNIKPEETIFIDDKKENIEAGESFGMKGIVYSKDTTNLEEEIEKIISIPVLGKYSGNLYTENFKFPADFIAEGLDQTRGWFYTLLILGTALFDNTPFLNVIVNGIVLAEDGKKMSKSLKNYPDPKHIFDKYGADAMRFYLMNSPVVEAQDLRFSEAGVEEIVKKVILPLWNTYSFFTTYANIDNFEPKKGNLYFVRHAESESNAKWASIGGSVSGGNDNPKLTNKGIEQAIKAGKKLKLGGVKIDKIYTSDLERTIHTAELIAKEIGFDGEIISLKELREQNYSDFEGKTHRELSDTYGVDVHDHVALRKIFKNSSVENYYQFDERINSELEKILKENPNKNILIVGHAGSSRPIFRKYLNLEMDYAHLEAPTLKNSQVVKMPAFPLTNNLDKWIISELYTLIKNVSIGLDSYKINEATKYIVSFMDNLTNWYIRRSRKRFWKSENDNDKIEAYNTLYEVLVELSKIISPFMPFVSENIYKSLTGNKSVHLDVFPENIPSFIQEDLNKDMDKTQKIINLGLAWRANNKIRVRQPLKSITIGEKLSQYYEEIIKEELNLKEIISVDGDKIAKKICKPNGRNIGPKFGGDVKFIMSEAKAGNFEELPNGDVKVGEFVLENGDFELVYEAGDTKYDIEAGFGMVIAMDSEITQELKLEGYSRDIVRQIQEARKEANYNVDDRIKVALIGDKISENIIKIFGNYIETETLSKIENNIENPDLEKNFEFEELKVKIVLRK